MKGSMLWINIDWLMYYELVNCYKKNKYYVKNNKNKTQTHHTHHTFLLMSPPSLKKNMHHTHIFTRILLSMNYSRIYLQSEICCLYDYLICYSSLLELDNSIKKTSHYLID